MDKVLFLTFRQTIKPLGGGTAIIAMEKAWSRLVGKENVDIVAVNNGTNWNGKIVLEEKEYSKLEKIRNLLQLNPITIDNKEIKQIISLIKNNGYTIVYMARPDGGWLPKRIKKETSAKIITFHQDVYKGILKDRIKEGGIFDYLKILPYIGGLAFSEGICARYSDINIVFNSREGDRLHQLYGKKADCMIPMIVDDHCTFQYEDETPFSLLFVGAYLQVNIEGITWFCKYVMPLIDPDVVLRIIGYRMENLKGNDSCFDRDNIEVIGTVDDIDYYYRQANVVVAPIFSGTGMKTKTAEALMHGKLVLGSDEAFWGYTDDIMQWLCNTPEEYAEKINALYAGKHGKWSQLSRDIYEKHYSVDSASKKLSQLL